MCGWNRRDFLKLGVATTLGTLLPINAFAAGQRNSAIERVLAFHNLHTGESLRACFFKDHTYQTSAMAQINHILRDHRTNVVKAIDPDLLDLLFAVDQQIPEKTVFQVISGYRCPETNRLLRQQTSGVAKKSLHMKGKAIDFRLPGFDTARLRDICIQLRSGGVGYYPRSDFIHIDTGRVRAW